MSTTDPQGMDDDIVTAINGLAIVLLRIYDAQMAILEHLNPETADMLQEVHDTGRLLGAPPYAAEQPFVGMDNPQG